MPAEATLKTAGPGTAIFELTIPVKDGEIKKKTFKGCFVKKDANAKSIVKKGLKPTDDKNKLKNSKYLLYAAVDDLDGVHNITEATLTYNKIAQKLNGTQKKKSCVLKDPLVVVLQNHLFLCCDSEDLNKSKFLEQHSKALRSNQSLGSSHMVKAYGLGCIENKLLFHPFKTTQCQSTRPGQSKSVTYKVDINDYRKLEDAGPLLLSDDKTVVGNFRKIGDQKITITIFGKQVIMPYRTNEASFPKVPSSIVIPSENGLAKDDYSDDAVNANGLEREDDTVFSYERELNELCRQLCQNCTCLEYLGHCICDSLICCHCLCFHYYCLKIILKRLEAPPRIVAECKSNLPPSPTFELLQTPRVKQIKEGCNPSKVLLEDYVYQTMPEEQLTVRHFRRLITKMKRHDILNLLNRFGITHLDEARSIKDVIPCDSEIMNKLCLLLNKEDGGLKGWRSLASLWGIKPEVYSKFKPSKKRNPFKILFLDWLIVERPDFSVKELCDIFGELQMKDAKEFLERKVRERTKSTQH